MEGWLGRRTPAAEQVRAASEVLIFELRPDRCGELGMSIRGNRDRRDPGREGAW